MSAEPTPLPDVLAAVTLGPEDRLILAYPRGSFGYAEAEYMDSFLRERGLSGRVVLANGVEDVIVLRATKAEGSTVGQCGDRLPPLFGAREYAPGESVQSCHLAYGHTGMHSDGTATWTNKAMRRPVCGEDFCESCGDCLACYGEDECMPMGGSHTWPRHRRSGEGGQG